jgi:hypothetical protein
MERFEKSFSKNFDKLGLEKKYSDKIKKIYKKQASKYASNYKWPGQFSLRSVQVFYVHYDVTI